MSRYALVVGVGKYESGLPSLPEARSDAQAMQQVLQQRGFDKVQLLVDPPSQDLEKSLTELLVNRQENDTLLFYFSGHGMQDDSGELYLTTRTTKRDYIKQTSISSRKLSHIMNANQGNQILILDCCYSGTVTKEFSRQRDLISQSIIRNRAILTSSVPLQAFSNQQESNLSVYTHCLVQGLKTGLADSDQDGIISINDLFQYVKRELEKKGLEQKPELFLTGKSIDIYLTTAKKVGKSDFVKIKKKEDTNLRQSVDIPLLIQSLKSQNPSVRRKAIEILGNTRSEDAALILPQLLLEDEDADVRGAAAEALGKIYEKQGV
ncbi:MAG: caspase family protein [Pseudanabaena sp. M165S2SP1A06QC]|nr:caspase family protein [Pseudanabaena sp. M165S2SP1A06QC]